LALPAIIFSATEAAFIVILASALIRRKRSGKWKRPWSFPIAMCLLGFALCLALAVLVRIVFLQFGTQQ